jgi:hypothetical protein
LYLQYVDHRSPSVVLLHQNWGNVKMFGGGQEGPLKHHSLDGCLWLVMEVIPSWFLKGVGPHCGVNLSEG